MPQSSEPSDIESHLAEKIQLLYHQTLGQQPEKIVCSLSDQTLCILMENAVTKTEELLNTSGEEEIAKKVSSSLDGILKPQLKQLVEGVIDRKVSEVVTSTQIETGQRKAIVIVHK